MAERKAVIKNADMSEDMQQDAVDCASQALEKYNIEKVRTASCRAVGRPQAGATPPVAQPRIARCPRLRVRSPPVIGRRARSRRRDHLLPFAVFPMCEERLWQLCPL